MTAAKPELPLYRLYLLRVSYALLGVLQGLRIWPAILHHSPQWEFWHGVAMSFFGALTLLALLGIRYPVRMLPVLLFEVTWKLIWVLAAYLPPYLAHSLDADLRDNFASIFLGVVVVPLLLPWGYIWRKYVTEPGDRWR
jgi:hypothetical protein